MKGIVIAKKNYPTHTQRGGMDIHGYSIQAGYEPQELTYPKYLFSGTFPEFSAEEAAARILYFSRQCNKWVGVRKSDLESVMIKDQKIEHKRIELYNKEHRSYRNHANATQQWEKRNNFTLGVYSFFVAKPKMRQTYIPEMSTSSLVGSNGLQWIWDGIEILINRRLINKKIIAGEEVFFPTIELLIIAKKFIRKETSMSHFPMVVEN